MGHIKPEERQARIDKAVEKYQEDKIKECQEKGLPISANPTNLIEFITAQVDAEIAEEEKPKPKVAEKVTEVKKKVK